MGFALLSLPESACQELHQYVIHPRETEKTPTDHFCCISRSLQTLDWSGRLDIEWRLFVVGAKRKVRR